MKNKEGVAEEDVEEMIAGVSQLCMVFIYLEVYIYQVYVYQVLYVYYGFI